MTDFAILDTSSSMKQKAIILDRDGTLIVDKIYLNDPQQVEFLPNTFEALRLLRDSGYVFIVATNQSGVARGLVSIDNLYAIHQVIRSQLCKAGIDILGFYYAPYMTQTNHFKRKPNPGMLLDAARDWQLNLSQSWMVGDRMTDVEAGHRAGCKTVYLENNKYPQDAPASRPPTIRAADLFAASMQIVKSASK